VTPISFLLDKFSAHADAPALIWQDEEISFGDLLELYERSVRFLDQSGFVAGSVAAVEADFAPASVAMLLALIERGAIIVPLTATIEAKKAEYKQIAQAECCLRLNNDKTFHFVQYALRADHPLLRELKTKRHAGLIVFSSGTTGATKAALHDFLPLLEKYKVPRMARRMIGFLLFDHLGGLNTLFYSLSNAGALVLLKERSPQTVVEAIARHRIEVLPTSPTFLNLILMSEAHKRADLSSLTLITYGTEPMPASLLHRLREAFPWVELQQTYGLTELGVLRSKSKSSDSLWVKLGGNEFETRVRDGLLEIKAKSAMLGYLNAPSPFTEDGWYMTGDRVEVDGEYVRILGRDSNIINVGGQKVYPAEVTSALLDIPGVTEAVVAGEPNPIVGSIVKAFVKLSTGETPPEFRMRMRKHLQDRGLASFKIPQKVTISEAPLHSPRFKAQVSQDWS
jgi:acyl-coenzyme A synthetase/AMP-(fatty) acid ligase